MKIEIRAFDPKDYQKSIQFAVKGMSFDRYSNNKTVINMYAKNFLYFELSKATQAIAAYVDNEMVGLLLAEIYGEPKLKQTFGQKAYLKIFNILRTFSKNSGLDTYEATNKELLRSYKSDASPEGEILYLAADPEKKIKDVGTALINELTAREPGKEIFLFTDTGCTYQFYEHKGFQRAGARDIQLDFGQNRIDLTAMLFSKKLAQQ
ncbi:N-acetyltransferase [Lactococcus garvieae]|uniref:N-acetyltransferase domain-containing protein n=1 Tax=Lactococcus garvieae (strain Lg2) TaxID=420890 RepID=F9VFC6_LACGL|nr:GNAT family acetyltransferase [Lactococcus garvieae]EOT32879.1 hypothetical protein OO3_00066 [Lactococcus garvieae ATCC 49156]EOT92917.1 hypothetical protein I578_00450 [Lactococcus garvieae ATCC 49156]BAK59058.1 hypothetical protein LCGT_1545 [Lactococcus garvieae ATCC 49156]BAK61027.1 hypothetical protein LCGL_1567 [Lactococcus garvieae Lg2]BDW47930.1 hypothetical protein LG21E12_15110 [Lactococcus garvieae]